MVDANTESACINALVEMKFSITRRSYSSHSVYTKRKITEGALSVPDSYNAEYLFPTEHGPYLTLNQISNRNAFRCRFCEIILNSLEQKSFPHCTIMYFYSCLLTNKT